MAVNRTALLASVAISPLILCAQGGPVGLPSIPTLNALKGIPSTQFTYVERLGYASPGDGGSMKYRASGSACSLNSGAGDNGSQVQSSDGKCWLADFPATGMDIRVFGAVGDNTTDTLGPLLAALASQPTTKKPSIVFPPGKFKFTARASYTLPVASYVNITGSGEDSTELTWPAGTGGLRLIYQDQITTSHIRDLTISTGTTSGGDGINLTQNLDPISNPANTPPSYIEHVTIRGADGQAATDYWTNGVNINGVGNVTFIAPTIVGAGNQLGTLVNLGGGTATRVAAPYNFISPTLNWGNISINHGPYVQGVTVSQGNFVGGNYGIRVDDTTATSQLNMVASHMNMNIAGFYGQAPPLTIFEGNSIFLATNGATAFQLLAADNTQIINNAIRIGETATSTVGVRVVSQTNRTVISNNVFRGVAIGIWYNDAGIFDSRTYGNVYDSITIAPVGIIGGATTLADVVLNYANVVACDANHSGYTQMFADSTTNVWGAVIAGGGPNTVLGQCNGANWTVLGK